MIKGNIDFSTGNIESGIATIILGDVKSGFKVNVKKDIEINGTIEDAEIYAGGGIVARGEIYGRGNGKITAEGDISAQNCQKMTLISRKDIILNGRAADCKIIADGKIMIKSKKSEILRCTVIAKDGIKVRDVGNDNYEPVKIVIGMPGEFYLEREVLNVKIKQLKESVAKTEKSLKLTHKMRAFGKSAKEQKEKRKKLEQNYSESKRKLGELSEKRDSIVAEIESKKNNDASLIVFNKIYPRVSINICDKKLKITC